MNQNLLVKLLYSSLVLTCIDPQTLIAMDTDEKNLKRPLKGGSNEFDRPQKRQCLPLDLSQIPLDDLIEAAYQGNKECRDFIVDKVFHGHVGLNSSNISLSKLLCINQRKISVETLTLFEVHIICLYNPDNILATDTGKSLLEAINARAEVGNDTWAQYTLASIYSEGIPGIVDKNLDIAFKLCTQAANKGFAPAQNRLGYMYRTGDGTVKNPELALKLFTQAADQGLPMAQQNLGMMYDRGVGVEKNLEQAVHWLTQAANQGYAAAQNNLGMMYDRGVGVAKNFEQAVHWYTQAANQGNAQSQYNLGLVYDKGEGVAKNAATTVHWYTQAANQGHAAAQNNLGIMYDKGVGVEKNLEQAAHWYTQAANQGQVNAQQNLGMMYDRGVGVAKNFEQAVHWYTQAANQGNAQSQYNLGLVYDKGEGVAKNAATTVHWFSQAANQGHAKSQNVLKSTFKIVPQNVLIQNQGETIVDIKNIENILGDITCRMGLHELRNNPERGMNHQGFKIAIPSLLPYYEQCGQFAIDMFGILKHLTSQEALVQGFLVNCLGLTQSPLAKDLAAQLRGPNYRGNFIHLLENPISGDLYFSFEKDEMTKNLYYTYLIQEFLDPKSQRNLDLNKAVKHLKKVYEGKVIILLESEGALIQDNLAKMCSGGEKESVKFSEESSKLADLNKKIEEEKIMIEAFENILLIKEKVLEIVLSSSNPRNLEFQKSSPLWSVLNK